MPTTTIHQSAATRRQAAALLLWLREADPTSGIGDLFEIVLCSALNARGVAPRLPERHPAGRRSSVVPVAAIVRNRLNVRRGRRSALLLAQARDVIGGSTSALWATAVAECYQSITAPVSAEDQGTQRPFEAAA